VFAALLGLTVATPTFHNSKDPSTYANIDEIRTDHLNLEIYVDFEKKSFIGTAIHNMTCVDKTGFAVFDYQGIEILEKKYGSHVCYKDECYVADVMRYEDLNKNLGNALKV